MRNITYCNGRCIAESTIKSRYILFNFFHPYGVKKCEYLDEEQTLKMIINNNMSLIRWGDGETQFVYGRGIYFQDYNEDLKNDLIAVITNKSQNVLKAIPVEYLEDNIISLILKGKLRVWSYTRYYFYRLLSEDIYLWRCILYLGLNQS
jgi:hypothetical protein